MGVAHRVAAAALAVMIAVSLDAAHGDGIEAPIRRLDAAAGKALFERQWVAAPASTDAADGLGPLFNARSCSTCHHQGRGAYFETLGGETKVKGLVVRVAAWDGSAHPELGHQIQDRSVPGLAAEGRVKIKLVSGGLQTVTALAHPPATPAVFEVRLAPSLRGKALLDLIDDTAILARADPEDRDGDGISGRPHLLSTADGARRLGRYGSKASVASLVEQTANAAALDIGLSSPLAPRPHGDCTAAQKDCLSRPTGRSQQFEGEEVSAEVVRLMAAYLETLKAPEADLQSAGSALFSELGCAACHVPLMPARDGKTVQVFTDLLLHDLGPAGASAIRDGDAAPGEWRTAPLRDLDPAGGTRRYMHGGEAATIAEAIALHDGEAASAGSAFLESNGREQQVLIEFLSGL